MKKKADYNEKCFFLKKELTVSMKEKSLQSSFILCNLSSLLQGALYILYTYYI